MSQPATGDHRLPDDREGLSPSPEAPSPRVITIADIFGDDDHDDIEFEPSTEQSEISDVIDGEDDEDEDEYVGMHRKSQVPSRAMADIKKMRKMI
jgi:hypothetical protein